MLFIRSPFAFLIITALAAAFAFSAPLQAQYQTYVDLAIDLQSTTGWTITATNQGGADAYGVTVYIEAADQLLEGFGDVDFDLSTSTTCKRIENSKVKTGTCASGVWSPGHLAAGESKVFRLSAKLVSTLTEVTAGSERYPVPAFAEFQDTTIPAEPEFLKHNNSDSDWLATSKDRTSPTPAQGIYWLEAGVDDLLPEAGDTVKFSFKAAMEYATVSRDTSLRGVKLRLKLSPGMGTPTATPPGTTTFTAATGLARTWDWDIGTFQSNTPLELVVSTTLDNPLPSHVARSDLCLTAELTARPDNVGQGETSAEICLREDPAILLREGDAILFNMYPCVDVTAYPCSSDDTLELRVVGGSAARAASIGRNEAVLDPDKVFIQVKDPEARIIDTQNSSVNSGSAPSWQTAREPDSRSGNRTVGGVEISYTRKEFDSTQIANYSNLARTMAVAAMDGGTAPGLAKVRFPGSGNAFYDLTSGTVTKPAFALNTASTAVVPYFVEFSTLGTYKIDFTAAVTHTKGTPSDATDDVVYSDTGSYIFHVGPITELAVRDGGPNPELATGTRAFTVVAVNNGPEDTPAVQIAVTRLNAGDYVSHRATGGSFDSGTGVWSIGELKNKDFYQSVYGRDGEILTIITSANVDTEITAAISNTQDYQVCIDSSGGDVDAASQTACTGTSRQHLAHGTPYYDYISDNNSATIKAKEGTGADLPASGSASKQDTASMVVTWAPVGALNNRLVTHYEVEWSTDGATNWQQLADDVPGPRYVDTAIEPGQTRYYRVRAVNDWDHKGPWSATIIGRTAAGGPGAPTGVSAVPDGGSAIDVSWSAPLDDGGSPIRYYEVQWSARRNRRLAQRGPHHGRARRGPSKTPT